MQFFLRLAIFSVLALGLGFGLSFLALDRGASFGSLKIGPWTAWPAAGTANPDPYSAAYLSRSKALILNVAEGMQFVAQTDSAGRTLSGNCSYLFQGDMPSSAFWTLYAADEAGRYVAAEGAPRALNSNRILRRDNGNFAIHIGSALASENWLRISTDENFTLVLNIYDASAFAGIGDRSQPLPNIILEQCT